MDVKKNILIMSTLLLCLCMITDRVCAAEIYEFYNGARQMAMGGASIGVVNDETALLSNPAGLGKLRNAFGTILDPEIDLGSNAYTFYKDSAYSNPFDLTQVKNTTDANRDKHFHARAQVFPSFVVRNFGIGIFAKNAMDARMNTAGTAMTTHYVDDMALVLGINLRLFDGILKIGGAARGISRIIIDKDIDPLGSLDKSANASEGTGVGIDGGVILSAPIAWLPSISAVVRDSGGTKFTSGGARLTTTTRPADVEQDIDVAFSVFPIHANRARSSFTIEYQKIKEAAAATSKTRYYHVGYEFNYADMIFFRAGMNQIYWTAGLELATEHTQVQLTSYGEDVGPDGSPEEDRRYVIKFALRF